MSEVSLRRRAARVRGHVLRMTHASRAPFLSSCLSVIDILVVLYSEMLKRRAAGDRVISRVDRVVLSKGHAAAALYATLAELEALPVEALDEFCKPGAMLGAHVSHRAPGVEFSVGSPGHGLAIGVGLALALRADRPDRRVFVLAGDGECCSGEIWESALAAVRLKLDNLVLMVDVNGIRSASGDGHATLVPFADKWRAFGFAVREVDGHDYGELGRAFRRLPVGGGRPSALLCQTIKGAGVSFLEERDERHGRALGRRQLRLALAELEE